MLLEVFVSSLVLQLVLAYPHVPPMDTCVTMDYLGGTPETRPMPYTLMMDAEKIDSDGCVYFTIKANAPNTFTGFVVQARGEKEKVPVGIFTESKEINVMECYDEPDNTATHLSNLPKEKVTMQWSPDNGYEGKVIFHATVVKTNTEYWVRQQAKPLTVTKAKHNSLLQNTDR